MECELASTTVHYEVFGQGRPFLMLHGGAGDHHLWVRALEPLFEQREGWQRIYPDLPGHGRTAAPAGMDAYDQVLDLVLGFIDHVIPGQRFAVGGMSWGGNLAQGVLHHRFSQVSGCLFMAPGVQLADGEASERPPRTILVRDETPLAGLGDGVEAERLRELYENLLVVQSPAHLERLRCTILPALEIPDDPAWRGRARYQGGFSFQPQELPQPSDKPTLFLLGRQDHIVGYRNQWRIIEQHPRATFAVLDGAGHGVAGVEQVEVCRALINEWLDRVEQSERV
jgi:pimeloyl-ACP methyl ester carboxylesterase